MSLNFDNKDSLESLPAADIVAPSGVKNTLLSSRSLPVKIPKKDADDFLLEVSASDLREIRQKIVPYTKRKFSWSEILIGLAGTALGATIGALSSQISIQSILGTIFYVICPVVTVGCIVRYFSESKSNQLTASNLAQEILSEIPNPDEAIAKELLQ